MGLKLSSLFSRNKIENQKRVEYSSRTTEEMCNARRTGKLIYPPLSSIPSEEPKRSVTLDGGPLYKSVHIDWGPGENKSKHESEKYRSPPHLVHYYSHYDDGTIAVFSREPRNNCNTFRV